MKYRLGSGWTVNQIASTPVASMPAAGTARRRRAVPVRHSRTRDTSQVTKSSAPSAMSKRYPVNGVRPRGRDSRLDGAIIACAVASLPPRRRQQRCGVGG